MKLVQLLWYVRPRSLCLHNQYLHYPGSASHKTCLHFITVDHYSDYFEVDELQDILSATVVHCTRQQFARHGIPKCCVTDGGLQFVSQEYHNFSTTWGFNHITSSPHHAQGKAKAESAVSVAKNLLKKSKRGNGDFELALLEFRNTMDKA